MHIVTKIPEFALIITLQYRPQKDTILFYPNVMRLLPKKHARRVELRIFRAGDVTDRNLQI